MSRASGWTRGSAADASSLAVTVAGTDGNVRVTSERTNWHRPVALLLLFMGLVLIAPSFAPYDLAQQTTVSATKNQAPSLLHPMGTDATDRDVFTLVLRGAQISLSIGLGSVSIALLIGAAYGALAAMLGGWRETLLMRITDVSLAVPRFLILLAVTSISVKAFTSLQLMLLIGCTGWFGMARLMRGEVSALLQRDWVLAAQATGVHRLRLAVHHLFPHLVPMLLVFTTIGIGHTIVLEAALAFLGAGGSGASLGFLLHSGSSIFASTWWLAVFPGLAIVLLVFACNALGDALRDVFSPEQVHSWPTT